MNLSFLSLANAWQLLGWTMILFLAAGTIVFLVGGALRVVLKRANPSARYATSLATFAMLALLPLAIAGYLAANIEASLPRQWGERSAINPTRQRGEEQTTKYTKELPPDQRYASVPAQEARLTRQRWEFSREAERVADERVPASPIVALNPGRDARAILYAAATYLPWLWIVGTPLTFLLLATGLIGAERLRSSCQLVGDGPIRTACDELRAALGIGRQVGVAICERIATPLLVGVVKPLILLPPAALNGWTTAELEMVLVHELAHVRRWDNAVNLVQRIVEALLFFHPAVWIVSGWVRRDREDCCDAIVVAHTAKPQAYAELLLALASHQPGLAASAALAQHPVAGRIRRILKLEDEPMLVTRKGFAIGVSAVAVATLLAFALPTTDAEEASPASRQRQRPENTASATGQRVADERAETTNPTRQRGEEQTTNQDFNAESAEAAENPLTEYTVTYDASAQARFAELVEHLRGVGECRLTSDNDDQIVVTARRSVHEKVANFLASIRDPSKKTTSGAPRPIIYAEQTEKLPDGRYKFSFLVPWVRAVDDPARRATTETLIKSDMLLERAIKEMDLLGGAQPSVMDSLRKDLSVHYSPEGHMLVALTGAKDGEAAVAAYAAHIINEYLKEHAVHLAQNQHDLATEDHQYDLATTIDVLPPSEKQVSRDAEQVADDRYGTTNPTRQRGEEQTTKLTNDTNHPLTPNPEPQLEPREIVVNIPAQVQGTNQLADILESVRLQGFKGRIDEAINLDGLRVNQLCVTVPGNSNPRVEWSVVWQESNNHLVLPHVTLVDDSGKPIDPSPVEPSEEQTTNQDLNAEDAKSAKDAEKSPNKDDDSVQIAVVYALYDDEAEIKRWLKTIDELSDTINMFTKDGKEMVVVSGTRKGHEKLAALLEGIRGEASRQRQRPENTASATGQRPEVNAEAAKEAEGAEKGKDNALADLGIMSGENFIPSIRRLFEVSDSNPNITKEYPVHDKSMPRFLEVVKHYTQDPDGPQVAIPFKWLRDVHRVEVTVPQKAHEEILEPLVIQLREQLKKPARANHTNQGLNAESTKEAENAENSLFPTLAEQRAADLAYKLLGVELEKLSLEELERVKATGYKGGLRVTGSNQKFGIGEGDLLVGLHVWPTESLEQVTEILSRDDLDQLSPLKFYFVRKVYGGESRFSGDSVGKDEVITVRIQVDLDAWRARRDLIAAHEAAVNYEGQRMLAVRAAAKKYELAKQKYERAQEAIRRLPGAVANSEVIELKIAAELAQVELEQLTRGIEARRGKPGPVRFNPGPDPNPFSGDDDDLLYDGKAFDEWRSLWKSELKTEKRIECIRALAAFGRAGKGKEAAEAILDVAAEYDFTMDNPAYIKDNAVGKLKESILEVLTNYGNHLSERDWLHVLKTRIESEPAKYRGFTAQLLPRLVTSDASVKPILSELQKSEDQVIRQAALRAIFISQEIFNDEEKKRLIHASLDNDPSTALHVLGHQLLEFVSVEQAVDFMLNEDPKLQLAARIAPTWVSDKEKYPEISDRLVAVIVNKNRRKDHLAAVRALAALAYARGSEVEVPIRAMVSSTEDEQLMIAAAYANERVTGGKDALRGVSITLTTKDAIKKAGRWPSYTANDAKLDKALRAEAEIVTGEQSRLGGGGMGGMGGGGMF